jgi:transcription initiation factor TFIIB|tara:strand:+ start:1145 stop:1849 length:705 start_codon:yes stop_codon:yes gene_type:complete
MGLSTTIDKKNVDASGKVIQDRGTLKRMRIWDGRTQIKTPSERNLKFALTELNRLVDKLSIPESTGDKAAYYYRKTLEKKLTRGRAISVIIAACLYAACRTEMIPRNLNDVYRAANLKKKDIATCYRLVVNELEIQMPLVDSTHIVSRITSKINVSQRVERIAIKFLEEAKAVGETAGKDPMGIASAAVYLASILTDANVTQREIADAAEVTEVTIRNRLSKLKLHVNWKQYNQ